MHLRGHLLPLPSAVMSDVYLLGKLQKKAGNLRAGGIFKNLNQICLAKICNFSSAAKGILALLLR